LPQKELQLLMPPLLVWGRYSMMKILRPLMPPLLGWDRYSMRKILNNQGILVSDKIVKDKHKIIVKHKHQIVQHQGKDNQDKHNKHKDKDDNSWRTCRTRE